MAIGARVVVIGGLKPCDVLLPVAGDPENGTGMPLLISSAGTSRPVRETEVCGGARLWSVRWDTQRSPRDFRCCDSGRPMLSVPGYTASTCGSGGHHLNQRVCPLLQADLL